MKLKTIRVRLAGDPDEGLPDHEVTAEPEEGEDIQACAAQLNVEVQEMRRAARQANEAREKLALVGLEEKDFPPGHIRMMQERMPAHHIAFQKAMSAIDETHLRLIRSGKTDEAVKLKHHQKELIQEFQGGAPRVQYADPTDIPLRFRP